MDPSWDMECMEYMVEYYGYFYYYYHRNKTQVVITPINDYGNTMDISDTSTDIYRFL